MAQGLAGAGFWNLIAAIFSLWSIWSPEADLKTKMEVQLMGVTPARKRGAPSD